MQPYDIFMLIVLVGAALFGAWKGMAWQLASIGSVLLSTIVALRFSGLLAPSLSAEEPWNQFLAMGILFACTSLGVWIAFRFVAKAIDRVKLKEFDRQMGALFGAAKGVLYCLILTFFAVTLSEDTRQRVLDSRSGYYATVLVQKGTPMMPEKVRKALGKYIQKLDEGLNPDTPPATPTENPEGIGDTIVNTAVAGTGFSFPPQGQPPVAGEQPTNTLPPLPLNFDPEALKQGAQNLVSQHADDFRRRAGTTFEENYGPLRESVGASAERAQSEINRGFDALGRRIQQAPMERIE